MGARRSLFMYIRVYFIMHNNRTHKLCINCENIPTFRNNTFLKRVYAAHSCLSLYARNKRTESFLRVYYPSCLQRPWCLFTAKLRTYENWIRANSRLEWWRLCVRVRKSKVTVLMIFKYQSPGLHNSSRIVRADMKSADARIVIHSEIHHLIPCRRKRGSSPDSRTFFWKNGFLWFF